MPKGIYPGNKGRKPPKSAFKVGIIPWNKGKKGVQKPGQGFQKGNKCFVKSFPSRKGRIPWNKGKKVPQLSGDKHPMWRGGVTDSRMRIRLSVDYRWWRRAILERDNFTCQKYGTRGGDLAVHHINNFSDFPELRLAIDNGITLSKKAHLVFHKIYGKKNNTREQLEEFLERS